VGCKHLLKSSFVCDVDFVEIGSFPANELNAIQGDFGGIVEIIYNDDFVAVFEKSKRRERSNISSPTTEVPGVSLICP
jgi:hypothetical protein